MSYQDKIEKALLPVTRKLYDYQIEITGTEFNVVRVRFQEVDMYGDTSEPIMLVEDNITCFINYPDEIPLNRLRSMNNELSPDINESGSSTGVYFYDILPIEIWTKWTDHIEQGDFLAHTIIDDNDNSLVMILRVSENFGRFKKYLTWRKQNAAPYSGDLSKLIIEKLKANI